MRYIFLITLIGCKALTGTAQPFDRFSVRQYNTENGLPSNGIKGLEWDEKTSFLWIATEAGVIRFNGISFFEPGSKNPQTASSQRMVMMVRNNQGKIFAADEAGNVFFVNKQQLGLWSNAAAVQGRTNKLFHLVVSESFYKHLNNRPNPFLLESHKMMPANDSACWIMEQDSLYYVTPAETQKIVLPFTRGKKFFKIKDRCFINIDGKGVYLLEAGAMLPRPVALYPNNLKLSGAGRFLYWQNSIECPVLLADSTASMLVYENNRLSVRTLFERLPVGPLIRYVQYSEAHKTLFIGTDSKGLIIVSANHAKTITRSAEKANERNAYYSQVALPGNRVLTNEGHILGGEAGSIAAETIPVKGKFSVWIHKDGDSALWFFQVNKEYQNRNCLHRYDYRTRQTTAYPKIHGSDGGAIVRSGAFIYVANRLGLAVLEKDSLRYIFRNRIVNGSTTVYDCKEYRTGILLVATCRGVVRFNTHTLKADTLISDGDKCFRSIWTYRDYLFLGTYGGGFYIYKDGRIRSMPIDKNKYLLFAHCFMPDRAGFCWISTNRGLFCTRTDDLIQAFEKNLPQVYYHYYGKNDGLDMTEMNGGCLPCALELDNRSLSFPTMDGLLWVYPENINPILPGGDIYIDNISVDGLNMDAGQFSKQTLPSNTSEIILYTSFSGWCNKENIYLEYRLNQKGNWLAVDINEHAAITLSNLPAGDYTLQLRKLNGFGQNNYSETTIHFSIALPWHKQWWFYILLMLLAAALVWSFLRMRTRQYKIRQQKLEKQVQEKTKELKEQNEILEKNNTIKTRLISIISHDIITPLKFLNAAGKNLLEKRSIMPEPLQQETIKEITNTAQELQQLSTNILNWIKYQNENRRLVREQFYLHQLAEQVMGVLRSLAHQKGLTIENRIAENEQVYQFMEPLRILMYNLAANAINFSEKGSIIIESKRVPGHVIISVSDQGIGMSAAQIQNIMADQFIVSSANIDNRKGNGLGYLIIKDLLKMTGGMMQIYSTEGKGTRVEIKLPQSG